ncbi:Zeta toxin [Marinactinospora thermotolerans DSM 45154]|uniref:UDP-N-acetylglucosamine kinase n=1 Tax=Marinactinospora thermotolerans DSM 45154 TaxID=1122192 RepID=A0A1T4PC26_9ACTN|nr:zeta toxin family protein [Marinactinospora thermotolerans]SJZ89103.1 Zeta toxin [Marinactinospora thermotolerans DSM 45154]
MADPYEVPKGELQDIFDEYIKGLVFGGVTPTPRGERPVMVQLGGQLAAGKTRALKAIISRHGDRVARVSPDDFRDYHTKIDEIMREHPQEKVALTNQAMYAWSDMVREYAHANGYGLVTEGTFREVDYLLEYAEEMAQPMEGVHPGFVNEVVVVATPGDRSCLDMVGRYLADPPGEGRWADAPGHDASYEQLPLSVEALEASPHIHRVIVIDRSGTVHYDNSRGADGQWAQEPRASQVLRDTRGEGRVPFDQQEAAAWLSSYWKHAEKLLKRGELGPVTVPTMLALHERADRVAQVAYAGDTDRLAQHAQWQKVQKVVFMAANRGALNSELPHHPEKFLNADAVEKARFMTALRSVEKPAPGLPKDVVEAVKRAQQGVAPPTIHASPSLSSPASSEHRQGRGKGPDIER